MERTNSLNFGVDLGILKWKDYFKCWLLYPECIWQTSGYLFHLKLGSPVLQQTCSTTK